MSIVKNAKLYLKSFAELYERLSPKGLTPPQAVDLEQAMLGSMLLGKDYTAQVIAIIGERTEDNTPFYSDAHTAIYLAMLSLHNNADGEKPVDLLTVKYELERSGKLDDIGGVVYLQELTMVAGYNVESYAKTIVEKHIARELIRIDEENKLLLFEASGDVREIASQQEAEIAALLDQPQAGVGRFRSMQEVGQETVKVLHNAGKLGGEALSFGLTELDELCAGGSRPGEFVLLAGRTSQGKAQPLDSKVLTVVGWSNMGDLRIGDELASVDGKQSTVTAIFPQGRIANYRVTFDDGRTVDCSKDHLWSVYSSVWQQERVITTSEIIRLKATKKYAGRIGVRRWIAEWGKDSNLPIHPYVLGVLLGDGNLTSLSITKSDDALMEKVSQLIGQDYHLKRTKVPITWQLRRVGSIWVKGHSGVLPNYYRDTIRRLGLFGKIGHEKFIHPEYLSANKQQRLELLQGLLDTDGYLSPKECLAEYSSASESLALSVQYLARSLGASAKMSTRIPHYPYLGEIKTGRLHYRVKIRYPRLDEFFTLERKRSCVVDSLHKSDYLKIRSVKEIGTAEMQCIRVSHPSQLYITDDFTITHNTGMAATMGRALQKQNKSVAIFSLEMSGTQLGTRLLCGEAGVNLMKARRGWLSGEEWDRIMVAHKALSASGIHIFDTREVNLSGIRSAARHLATKLARTDRPLGRIILDYIDLPELPGKKSANKEIGDLAKGLRNLGGELGTDFIALSQINRDVSKRKPPRPMISDLAESGDLEEVANIILLLFRPWTYGLKALDDHMARTGTASTEDLCEVIVGKQRDGETGTVVTKFVKAQARFEDWPPVFPADQSTGKSEPEQEPLDFKPAF